MAAVTVDLELKKHFEELQVQVIESRTKMRQLDLQVEGLKRTCQASMLTKRELSTLPEGSNTYESVGRMFIKRSLGEINNILDDRIKKNEEKAASLDSNKKYLETNLKERENNLRDLVAQKILNTLLKEHAKMLKGTQYLLAEQFCTYYKRLIKFLKLNGLELVEDGSS